MSLAQILLGLLMAAGQPAPVPAAAKPTAAKPTAATPTAPTASAAATVDKVQGFYRRTAQLTARFRQTVVNPTFGRTTVSSGRVYIKKPGKMRWDYFSKVTPAPGQGPALDRAFMSDGKTLWAVFVDGKSFYKKNLADDLLPVAITFLSGRGDLAADFTSALEPPGGRGAAGDLVLALTPRKPSAAYKTLWLVVDGKDFRVKKSIIKNANNELSTFEFFEPNTTTAIVDTTFVFDEKGNAKKGFRRIEPPK